MQPDFLSIIERLAPHLAWPLVVLITLPFIIWRLGAIAKLYDLLTTEKGKDAIKTLIDGADKSNDILKAVEEAKRASLELKQAFKDREKVDIQDSSVEIENVTPDQGQEEKIIQSIANATPLQLFQNIQSQWDAFQGKIVEKYEELDLIKPDLRSIGSAGIKLGDRRRKNALSEDDVRQIARLHSQYKRFIRLQSDADDWLTPDVYASFIAALNSLIPKISRVGRTD